MLFTMSSDNFFEKLYINNNLIKEPITDRPHKNGYASQSGNVLISEKLKIDVKKPAL